MRRETRRTSTDMHVMRLLVALVVSATMMHGWVSSEVDAQQTQTSDVAIVATENGAPVYDACFVLVNFSLVGCDDNGDGKVTFQDVPLGAYTVRQTADLGPNRFVADSTIVVTGGADNDGWERFFVQVESRPDVPVSVNEPQVELAEAVVGSGRPPLPPGIVRLPFNGEYEVTQVPGCGAHDRNLWSSREGQELNGRALDFGLYLDEVVAAGEGYVLSAYTDAYGALVLVIDHGQGVRSYYVHLQEFWVSVGDHVNAGDPIGLSGNSGLGGQYHLHFAVTVNNNDDPAYIGDAANINSLPGLPWILDVPNADGFVTPCRPAGSPADIAVGGAVAQTSAATVPAEEPTLIAVGYDRNAAVDAAYGYLGQDEVLPNDSARYASLVLWAGGLPQTDEWVSTALDWPQDLVNYLVASHRLNEQSTYTPATITRLVWADNTAGGAMPGDLIAYDWEGDAIIDHVAVVTRLNEQGYPEVSEHSPRDENRYWSYSDVADNWIEFAYPGSVAYLIHISPLTVPDV